MLAGLAIAACARADGFLAGKHIYLSAGHGWYYNGQSGVWAVQRPNTNSVVEDFSNAESVDIHLIQYLENAGAKVWPCRQPDLNPRMVIVDDQDGASRPENGTYSEMGSWSQGSGGGFVNFRWPYQDGQQVFADFASGGRNRLSNVTWPSNSYALWTPNIPSAGYYSVSVSYDASAARTTRAHYVVRHTGGLAHMYVDQTRHGSTWVSLGRFHFQAGSNSASGSVMLLNESEGTGTVSADAVRFGGGPGLVDRGAGVSGYPQFEEAGRYWTFFSGAPTSVYDYLSTCYDAQTGCGAGDDAGSRSRYAAWQHQDDEDALYLSWHSNAGGWRGTSTWYHQSLPSTSESAKLARSVQTQVMSAVRALFVADWPDAGVNTLDAGEVNPANNPEMPAALVEVAFHDDATDALYLRNPRWRQGVARAVYQGIAKYFAARDGVTANLIPEPPVSLSVRNDGSGQVYLTWQPGPSGSPYGDAPESYMVYRSPDGLGFDSGRAASETSFTDSLITPGKTYYYRVAAVNVGGVSLPTETLAVRVTSAGSLPKVLIVNGYDRVDRTLVPLKPSGSAIGSPARERPEWVNTFNYVIQHAESLDRLGMPFDSASNEAVSSEAVSLGRYAVVDWIAGRQANVATEQPVTFPSFTAEERALVRAFAEGGGHLFVSGAEILYDQDRNSDPADAESLFVRDVLKVRYVGDDANTYQIQGTNVPFTPLPQPPPATPSGATSYALSTGTLYIPDGYQPPLDQADIMVHFHGADSVVLENFIQSGRSGVLVVINYPGLSAAYDVPFTDRHLFRTILADAQSRLSQVYGRPIGIGRLALTSFSAGYAAVRRILQYPDYDGMVTDIVLADSLYASYVNVNGTNVPDPAQIKDFTRMALRATLGRATFTMTHSQLFPGTYASTRECADAIISAVGATRTAASGTDATGMTLESTVNKAFFRIRSYQGTTGDDHMNHLHQMQEALKLTGFAATAGTGVFTFSNGAGATYDVAFPDRLAANGGWVSQKYVGGSADGAAASYSGDWRVVFLGYPFETLMTREARDSVMEDAMRFLLPPAGHVSLSIAGLPAQARPGQMIPLQWSATSSLDFNVNLDLWATLTHSSGRPSFTLDLLRNQPVPAGGQSSFPANLVIPAGAPQGAYTVSLYQGDFLRHIINQRTSSIAIAADQGFLDEFSGPALDTSKWTLVGAIGGQPAFSASRLLADYSSSGPRAGIDLISARALDGDASISASATPLVPSAGVHESGIALVVGNGIPTNGAATASLTLRTTSSGTVVAVWTVWTPGAAPLVEETAPLSSLPVALSVWRSGGQVFAVADAGEGAVPLSTRAFPSGPAYGWLFAGGSPGSGGASFNWAGMAGDSQAAHPVLAGSIGQVRLSPAGTAWLIPLHVTAGNLERLHAVQMPDRSAGALAGWNTIASLPVPERGSALTAFARLDQQGPVRMLVPFRYVVTGTSEPLPLFASALRIAGSAGVATEGLLMRAAGRVQTLDPQGVFTLDDGSLPLRVGFAGTAVSLDPPAVGSFVTVTGIVSADDQGPLLLPREQDDIVLH